MESIIKKLSGGAHTLGAILVGCMVVFVTAQVIARMFGLSLTFVDELSGYSAVWATLLGIGYALQKGRLVRVDLVTRLVSPRTRDVLTLIGNIACVLFSVIVIWKGSTLIGVSFMAERVTDILLWPVYLLQVVLPIGFILFGLEAILDIVKIWRRGLHNSD